MLENGGNMKREEAIRYEKPQLDAYRFAANVAVGATPDPGDIEEVCDSDFDE